MYQLSFRVFICAFHPEISFFFGKFPLLVNIYKGPLYSLSISKKEHIDWKINVIMKLYIIFCCLYCNIFYTHTVFSTGMKCRLYHVNHIKACCSRGNMLASRSKVRVFKSGWDRWIFSGCKNPEHKSSGRDLKLGIPSLRFQALKNLKPEKIGLWAKFNRHIHVLVIPKFWGAQ